MPGTEPGNSVVPVGKFLGSRRWPLRDPAVIERASKAADELASERGTRSAEARRKVDWELAQRLVMPVLLLRGSLSDVILRETADHFVSAVPIARCVDIPGSGHSPTLHEPEAQAAL